MPDQRMFSAADVEVARQRLNDNRYGGPDDLHDLDREDIHEIVQLVLTATWDRIYDEGLAEGRRQATESWERAYGVRLDWVQGAEIRDFDRLSARREDAEAHIAALAPSYRGIATIVSRLVGPWEPDPATSHAAPTISQPWEQQEPDEQPEPARRGRYMMATSALHKLGDISRDEPDLAIIYGDSGDDWVGQWVTGIGYINVRFPKATTRELTDAEKATYSKLVIDEAGSVRPIRFDEQPEPIAVERMSAETIASVLAVVDAPYRPGLNVEFDDEPEGGA